MQKLPRVTDNATRDFTPHRRGWIGWRLSSAIQLATFDREDVERKRQQLAKLAKWEHESNENRRRTLRDLGELRARRYSLRHALAQEPSTGLQISLASTENMIRQIEAVLDDSELRCSRALRERETRRVRAWLAQHDPRWQVRRTQRTERVSTCSTVPMRRARSSRGGAVRARIATKKAASSTGGDGDDPAANPRATCSSAGGAR